MSEDVQAGHLYVVATPIGNRADLSPRALHVLEQVDRIAAEDTRTTAQLLQHFGLRRPMIALHEHNEDRLAEELVARLRAGESLALVSDAGTPLVSDPGFALVRAARTAQLPVITVPGPSAVTAALSISGLPTDSFVFAGFLPPKEGARQRRLDALRRETRTLVLFEASHRIEDSLTDIVRILGPDRPICLARELTKMFEDSLTAGAAEVLDWLRADPNRQRGEFVLVIGGAAAQDPGEAEAERLLGVLLRHLPVSRAAGVVAELTGLRRATVYAAALRMQGHAADQADGPGST